MTVVSWHLANCGPCTRPAHLWPSTDAPTPATAAVVSSPALLLTFVCMLTVQLFIGGWHSLDSVDWAVTTAAPIAPFVPCILVGQPTCITILNAPWCVGDAPPPAGVLAAPTDGVLGLCMHAWCDVVTNQGSRGVIVLSLAAVALRGLVLSRLEGRVRSDRGTIREVEHSSFVLTVPALTLRLCPVSARPHTLPRVCWAC